jgi:hypothetical protein
MNHHAYPKTVAAPTYIPTTIYRKNSHFPTSGSRLSRGGTRMMEWSGGLNPSAVAGKLSVTRLTHSSCTGIKASGIPRRTVRNIL